MFYSDYLSLYLLQCLYLVISQTQLVQQSEKHTTLYDYIEETLFPEDGAVFMQRMHEFRHPVRASGEEIKRRFGDTDAPVTKKPIETFADRLINDPAYDYAHLTAPGTPIQKLHESTVFMPNIDNANPNNKDTFQENRPLINEYVDYNTGVETTVQNVGSSLNYKTGVINKIDEIKPSVTETYKIVEPNVSTFTPKIYDDYPIGATSTPVLDYPFMAGPAFKPKQYDEVNPMSTEKSIERFIEPFNEPYFTMQDFDVPLTTIQPRTTKIRKLNRTVLKNIADLFYPTDLETAFRSHRTRQGGLFFIQRSDSTSGKATQTTIQRPVGAQKHRPAFIQKSDDVIQKTSTQVREKPLYNDVVSMQKEHRNPTARDTVIQRFKEPHLMNEVELQNYDVDLPKTETVVQRFHRTRKQKPMLKKVMNVTFLQKSEITKRFHKPLRTGSDLELKADEGSYPTALDTGPTFKQRSDVTIPHIVKKINRTPSSTNTYMSSVHSLSISNPSFPFNLALISSPEMTNFELSSSAHITATHEPPSIVESGLAYPRTKTAYLPGSNLASTISYPPITELTFSWAPTSEVLPELPTESSVHVPSTTLLYEYEVFPESTTTSSNYVPSTTLTYEYQEINPMVLRTRAPKSTQLQQKIYTVISDTHHILPERLEPKQVNQGLAKSIELKQAQAPTTDLQEGEGTEPFSTFLSKLMKVLGSKNPRHLQRLIEPFERYITILVDSGKLMRLGIATGSFIAESTPLLHSPIKEIQRYLFIGQISLENRRRMLDDVTNEVMNELDDVYDVSEEEAMQRVLNEVTLYPNITKDEEQIVHDFVDDIFLHPLHRVAGTPKGNVVFESIAKFANKYISPIAPQARRNVKHKEFIDSTVSEDLVQDFTKLNEKNSILKKFNARGIKRKEEGKNIVDTYISDDRKDSNDESEVEIKIKINSGKYPKVKPRRNSDNIKNRESEKEDGKRGTEKKYADTSIENLDFDKHKLKKNESPKTEPENRGKVNIKYTTTNTKVKVQLHCEPFPIIVAEKRNGTGKPLTEMIMYCSNGNDSNDTDGSKSSDG